MRKIMLIIEEYGDLVSLENLLRRLGFDVLSLGKEVLLNDALARFVPDAIIANYKSRQVDGVRIAARMKKSHPPVRIALTYTGGSPALTPEAQSVIDALLQLPMQAASTIRVVAQILDLDAAPLQVKYQKLTTTRTDPNSDLGLVDPLAGTKAPDATVLDSLLVRGTDTFALDRTVTWDPSRDAGQSAKMRTDRSSRYDQFLAKESGNAKPAADVVPRDLIAAAIKQLKQAAEKEQALLDQIKAEKQAFTDALFTLKKQP